MDLSIKLKEAREKAGYSQKEVSEKLNVSRQSVSRWENGWTYPDVENLIILSDLYNISLDELLKKDYKNNEVNKEVNKEEKSIHTFIETIGIAVTAMLTCGIPLIGLVVNVILLGYCIRKKVEMNLIYKIILIVFLVLSVYNTWTYIDFTFLNTGKATLEKVAFFRFQRHLMMFQRFLL